MFLLYHRISRKQLEHVEIRASVRQVSAERSRRCREDAGSPERKYWKLVARRVSGGGQPLLVS